MEKRAIYRKAKQLKPPLTLGLALVYYKWTLESFSYAFSTRAGTNKRIHIYELMQITEPSNEIRQMNSKTRITTLLYGAYRPICIYHCCCFIALYKLIFGTTIFTYITPSCTTKKKNTKWLCHKFHTKNSFERRGCRRRRRRRRRVHVSVAFYMSHSYA